MPFDVTAGIVRILLGPQKATAGTGFVVNTEGLVVTCAHVVEDAHAGPGDTVSLIFYAAKEKGEQQAIVLPEYWCASNAEDIAFLRLKEKIPEGVEPLPLGRYVDKNNFSTFGFPKEASKDGRRGAGFVLGPPHEMGGVARLQLRSEETTKGFSGAPVWDDELQTVIGMVIGIGKGRSIKWDGQEYYLPIDLHGRFQYEAFATPTETLWKIYPDLRPADQCPYRNLEAFTRNDALYFFGRERILNELVKSLEHEPRFLAVLGPSGCGKSSLVQAGLLPRFEREAVFGSNQWQIILTRPTDLAFQETIASLPQKQQHIALIIDQFEELFMPYFEERRQEVVTHLKDLLDESPYLHLIVTLRNDFYSHVVQFEALEKWLKKGIVNVPSRLQAEEIRDIIQKPADTVRLSFDEGLVEIIVKDVVELHPSSDYKESGALNTILPLLEVALTQLWERRDMDQGKLTLAAYRIIGGVTGGLKQRAEEVYTALVEEERELACRIFIQLVYVNNDETLQLPYSRRQRRKDDLIHAIAAEPEMTERVIQHLIHARLLVTNRIDESATIELSHEALINEWPRLRDWLDKARSDILFQQSLSKDVTEWEQRKQSRDLLYRGDKLKQAREWARRNPPNKLESAFIQASATRQVLSLMSVVIVVLLLASSVGIAGWYVFFQPSKTLVTTLQDSGTAIGSLRWCIDNASSGSTIRFAQGLRGTIELTGGDLVFAGGKTLIIVGPGASQLTISGGNITSASIDVSMNATVTLSDLSFKNSTVTSSGGFFYNQGTLTITHSIISGNKTTFNGDNTGGSINNTPTGRLTVMDTIISNNLVSGQQQSQGGGIDNDGKLTVINSTFSNNIATSSGGIAVGGGITNTQKGTTTVTGCTFSNNSASGQQYGQGGAISNDGKLTVTDSTFTNNLATGNSVAGFGGGIGNSQTGTITVTNSTFTNNSVRGQQYSEGGGINNDGKLSVADSTFTNNTTISSNNIALGGGIRNSQIGTVMVTGSTFLRNSANGQQKGQGGGIYTSGKLTLVNSTLSNDTAISSDGIGMGGGITNYSTGTAVVVSSTFSRNSAVGKLYGVGGGIDTAGKLTMVNSTLLNNMTSGGESYGGGIGFTGSHSSSTLIRFSTLYANTSSTDGGGIWVYPTGNPLTISSNIIVANSASTGSDIEGALISGGYNLIENVSGAKGLNPGTDRQVALADLKIDTSLNNRGGLTQTIALLQGSPAIDAVPLQACSITVTDISDRNVTITIDQRGELRPDGSENACDVGAYESSY